jgi:hypothetical protein
MIARRPFGRHPDEVSIVGLGGYHLGEARTVVEAVRIVHAAIGARINFQDQRRAQRRRRPRQHGFPSQEEVAG